MTVLVVLLLISIPLCAHWGSADISFREVSRFLIAKLTPGRAYEGEKYMESIIWRLRMPRILLGIAVGGGLAVCGVLMQRRLKKVQVSLRSVIASAAGAITYVLLYMLKTFIYQKYLYAFPMDTVWAAMVSKLIPSLINAALSVVAAPVFWHALCPALKSVPVRDLLYTGPQNKAD